MTEAEWLACVQPSQLIESVGPTWRERRARLFAVECCRRLPAMPDARLNGVIETAERFADGVAGDAELSTAIEIANDAREWEARHDMSSWQYHAAEVVAATVAFPAEEYTAISAFIACTEAELGPGDDGTTERRLYAVFAMLVREVFGNPFRPVAFEPTWRTTDALLLARGIYEERACGRMPILADALQDAGCDSDDILNHLRDTNATHVRGCWALDLVLGKE